MTTGHDIYGISLEERAAFEKSIDFGCDNKDSTGRYTSRDIHARCLGWAACAKLYREKLAALDYGFQQIVIQRDAAENIEVELRSSIKELEAENARLRADAERLDWYFGPSPKGDFMDTFMDGMRAAWAPDEWRAAIDKAMKGGA